MASVRVKSRVSLRFPTVPKVLDLPQDATEEGLIPCLTRPLIPCAKKAIQFYSYAMKRLISVFSLFLRIRLLFLLFPVHLFLILSAVLVFLFVSPFACLKID